MTPLPTSWLQRRASGVLAHLSSLPGEYGIGNMGASARAFIDFLAEAGFHYWQICPLGPTGFGDSPYQSFSSFAGNPYFIDLQELVDAGLLTETELSPLRTLPTERVDFGLLYTHFWSILEVAQHRFQERVIAGRNDSDYDAFVARHDAWLNPYAIFMGLKAHHAGRPWGEWAPEFRECRPERFGQLPPSVARIAWLHTFAQFLFFRQWERLRQYAHRRGIRIIGDLPIFVALDSADVWQQRRVFRIDAEGRPLATAGVPPDYFSETGQFWGNPLYDWEYLARTGYAWWMDRLRSAFAMYDVIRLDHFRGFDTYWEIPAGSEDARTGAWKQGPGVTFFNTVRQRLPEARIIAEDLGYITPGVVELRRAAALPGMKILQFGYAHDDNNVNLPHFFPRDCVVYTGTHDNNTTRGWIESLSADVRAQVDLYFGLEGRTSAWPVMQAAFASVARLAVLPMQDLLDLPGDARMNRPGTAEGNWQWRFTTSQLDQLRAGATARLREWHELYDRKDDSKQREYSAPPAVPIAQHADA